MPLLHSLLPQTAKTTACKCNNDTYSSLPSSLSYLSKPQLLPLLTMAESQYSIVEERKELMVPPPGGDPTRRMAHFLRPPSIASVSGLPSPPLSSPIPALESQKWAIKVSFHGWRCKKKHWKTWVESLHSSQQCMWRKAGIYEAIMGSTYEIRRNDDLVYGVAAKWCPETNTFVFPWGEATITLEDVMILGGFTVLGESVSAPLEDKELVEIEEKLIEERRQVCRSSAQKACQCVWMARFMGTGSQLEHEAFLSLWLSRFVLPTKYNSTVEKHVFSIAIRLARGIPVALAPAVLASIYRDLSLLREALVALSNRGNYKKENFPALSLLAPLQFVQVWVWERFPALGPSPQPIEFGEPRVARWHKMRGYRVVNVGLALETARASFQWRPYVRTVDNWGFHSFYREREEWVLMGSDSDEELQAFARFLRVCKLVGVDDCMEWYFPHRVAMQFGMDQDLPGCVPECDESPEVAWSNYSKPINGMLFIPSRIFDSDVTTRYLDWWQSSVKREASGAPNPLVLPAIQNSSEQGNSDDEDKMTVEETLRYKQGDSDDEDKMTVGEMLRSILNPKRVGNKPATDDKPSPGCQLQSPSSSAAKVGAIKQKSVMKFLGVAAGGSEKGIEGGSGSTGRSAGLMGGSERDMEYANRSHSGTATMKGVSGEVVERADKSSAGMAAMVEGSEKGVEDAIEIKETSEKIIFGTIEIPGQELEARICTLERVVARLQAARFSYRF